MPGTLGLYAGRSFQADEYITEYGGVGMDKSDAKKLEESEKGYIHDWGEGKVRDGSPCAAHIHTAFPSALWSLLESPSAHAEVTRRLSNDVLTTGCGYMANCHLSRSMNNMKLKKVYNASQSLMAPALMLCAKRDIANGEELLYFYNNEEMRLLKRAQTK